MYLSFHSNYGQHPVQNSPCPEGAGISRLFFAKPTYKTASYFQWEVETKSSKYHNYIFNNREIAIFLWLLRQYSGPDRYKWLACPVCAIHLTGADGNMSAWRGLISSRSRVYLKVMYTNIQKFWRQFWAGVCMPHAAENITFNKKRYMRSLKDAKIRHLCKHLMLAHSVKWFSLNLARLYLNCPFSYFPRLTHYYHKANMTFTGAARHNFTMCCHSTWYWWCKIWVPNKSSTARWSLFSLYGKLKPSYLLDGERLYLQLYNK